MKTPLEVLTNLTTVRDYIRLAASQFSEAELCFGQGTVTALDEAAALVLHTIHQPYNLADCYFSAVLTQVERKAVIKIIERRINERLPCAYLTHESVFAGLSFYVDERVLIPRSPIAELIAKRFYPWVDEDQISNILDLCTGSACIAIACAYAFPGALVDAVDVSADALAVAEINVAKHHRSFSVALYESDLFNKLPDTRYDIIVSNPPYVSLEEWRQLAPEFHAEPELGLKGGTSGLDIVKRILIDAHDYLSDNGILVVEVGNSAQALQHTYPEVPFDWVEFEHGGDGVFILTADQVHEFHSLFLTTTL